MSGPLLPGAARVLAARVGLLPQPDQLCGPFAAHVALHAVLDDPPSVVDLARSAGTRVWPHDEPAWRPAGAPLRRDGWDDLARAATPEDSGTDAGPLAAGMRAVAPVTVVPVPAAGVTDHARWGRLLDAVRFCDVPVGVLANLRTGPTWPTGHPLAGWDVGHFVVVVSYDGDLVGVADSYAEAGAEGWAPGCRGVPPAHLAAALSAPPGRGLLLVGSPEDREVLVALVVGAGLAVDDAAW